MSNQYQGTGRRKKSIARVRLLPGNGQFTVNGRSLEEYIPYETLREDINRPFDVTGTAGKFDVIVLAHGGGFTGQSGAIRHGIARALIKADPELRPALKTAGFLTRDARMKERKKYGLKKARRAPQFSKR